MRSLLSFLRLIVFALAAAVLPAALAEPMEFKIPAQPADAALYAFSHQANAELLFSSADLHKAKSTAVNGTYEPVAALKILLQNTGYAARNSNGKFIITPVAKPTGTLRGRLLRPEGLSAQGVRVTIPAARLSTVTDGQGEFEFPWVAPGTYRLVATGAEYQPLEMTKTLIEANRVITLLPQVIQLASSPSRLAPFVVESRVDRARFSDRDEMDVPPREATGNLDLVRTQNDAIAYTIYDRDQISRSGVVTLNDFLQRELLDANSAARAPEQDARPDSNLYTTGSSNLSLRGYTSDETVVLVNGRRLPEVFVGGDKRVPPPDVNFIPLSLVQQVEVLPASASSLYTGNPVGGVINIILRPAVDANATEVTATYTNALRSFDAPQSSLSIIHAETLLGGALRLRLNASVMQTVPPTESELRYLQARPAPDLVPGSALYRATPTVRNLDGLPLFGPGTSSFTSVAPGADGNGGIGAFASRAGVRNLAFFNSPADLAVSRDSIDFPYGRKQQRSAYFGSVVYDVFPNLQVGLDVTYARTVATKGLDVFQGNLNLSATSPLNPFHQDVAVSLNETAPLLGENYSESRVEFSSAVLGIILKLPANWQLSLDTQAGHSETRYRGVAGANTDRWQLLVDQGRYNPLRDTQVFGPPQAFYDEVVLYRGERGKFIKQGDYSTLDIAGRATNADLPLPTGRGVFNFGGDYRRNHLDAYTEKKTYADGTLGDIPIDWSARSIQRYSVFGELQAPLLPGRWMPKLLPKAETDVAVRYIASDNSAESNVVPTFAVKLDIMGGFAARASFTTTNRFPTPYLTRIVLHPPSSVGVGVDPKLINDPVRHEQYDTFTTEVPNQNLTAEAAVTQTIGLLFKRANKAHRFRASVDFVDTRKSNEQVYLSEDTLINLESTFPDRVIRAPLAPGDTHAAGKIIGIYTGTINGSDRRSLNWNTSVDYAWAECFGGTLEFYGRLLYFQRYKSRITPGQGLVDQLRNPNGTAPGLLKYRSNFGASWSRRDFGFGFDGHYFHSRVIPLNDWAAQGHDRLRPMWQFDPFVQGDIGKWLPWHDTRYGLRLQFRVNNVFGSPFPKYVLESSGAGVQPYGDWRGRTYSLSLTATF